MAFLTSRFSDQSNDRQMSCSARSLSSMTNIRPINTTDFVENVGILDAFGEDNIKYATMSDAHSDIVPPLDIKSEENYPTTRDYTFSYRKQCEADKIALKPDKAFETWLSAKRKMLSDEAARRKKDQEIKHKAMEERKRLAKEKYDGWLQKKSQTSITLQSIGNHAEKSNTNFENRMHLKPSAEVARARLEEWERAKQIKEEQRRALKREEERQRRELDEQRRQMAAEAWETWVSSANNKPKPVPLNRGIFTLRGTVSDIFVNPNEWKPIIPVKNHDEI